MSIIFGSAAVLSFIGCFAFFKIFKNERIIAEQRTVITFMVADEEIEIDIVDLKLKRF